MPADDPTVNIVAQLGCDDRMPLDVRASTYAGEEGNWIARASMNRIYFVLTECLPGYQAIISQQDTVIVAQAEMIETSSRALSLLGHVVADERERADAWRRVARDEGVLSSPVFWLLVGTVVGVTATVGGAFMVGGRGG